MRLGDKPCALEKFLALVPPSSAATTFEKHVRIVRFGPHAEASIDFGWTDFLPALHRFTRLHSLSLVISHFSQDIALTTAAALGSLESLSLRRAVFDDYASFAGFLGALPVLEKVVLQDVSLSPRCDVAAPLPWLPSLREMTIEVDTNFHYHPELLQWLCTPAEGSDVDYHLTFMTISSVGHTNVLQGVLESLGSSLNTLSLILDGVQVSSMRGVCFLSSGFLIVF